MDLKYIDNIERLANEALKCPLPECYYQLTVLKGMCMPVLNKECLEFFFEKLPTDVKMQIAREAYQEVGYICENLSEQDLHRIFAKNQKNAGEVKASDEDMFIGAAGTRAYCYFREDGKREIMRACEVDTLIDDLMRDAELEAMARGITLVEPATDGPSKGESSAKKPKSEHGDKGVELPKEIGNERARKYLDLAVEEGILDEGYLPKEGTPRALLACFAFHLSHELNLSKKLNPNETLQTSWAPFEKLWRLKKYSLRAAFNSCTKCCPKDCKRENLEPSVKDYDKIRRIFGLYQKGRRR